MIHNFEFFYGVEESYKSEKCSIEWWYDLVRKEVFFGNLIEGQKFQALLTPEMLDSLAEDIDISEAYG